ncbi:hypothetical protein MUN82_08885 [Hymenobacter aerilatus]|uniref:Uncharacterized protein n=1 Tax=Hymenobacter aerilatus TaxID=2932251 RepID=A0A8T9SYP2_9BACT|nr:hypothetical protein [Hymenobacter aerilatus]UOR07198.1 hypothetical protein MUN82_08885 [Hymenobacter aerilatus]
MATPLNHLIETRQTELQRAYDMARAQQAQCDRKIRELMEQREQATTMIQRCYARALEQGVAHIL